MKMITEKEREKRAELLRLLQENPELPVVPMVDGEIVGCDGAMYWLGALGRAKIEEYFLSEKAERVFFKSTDDVFYVLERHLSDDEYEALPETEDECRPYYDALPWVKAIIVYINLPEVEGKHEGNH